MRRIRTWLFVLGALTTLLAAGVVATWVFFGPAIAKSIIVRNLQSMGVERVELTINRLGLQRVEITGIALGAETWLAIKTATATFGPLDLLRGRLKTLTLEDAKWAIRTDEDGINWGFPAQEGDGGAAVPNLPFDAIEIVRATVMVDRGSDSVALEIEGTIQQVRPHHVTLALALSRAEMSLDLSVEASGEPALDMLSVEAAATGLSVPAELRHVMPEFLRDASIAKLTLSYDLDDSRNEKVVARAAFEGVILGPETIDELTLSASESEDLMSWAVNARSSQWTAAVGDGEIRGIDSLWRGSDIALEARGHALISGAPPPWLQEWMPDGLTVEAPVQLELPLSTIYVRSPDHAGFELGLFREASVRVSGVTIGDFQFVGVTAVISPNGSMFALADSGAGPDIAAAARLSIGSARWRDRVVDGGDGAITLLDGRLSGEMLWRPTDEVDMKVRANAVLTGESPHATILFTSAPFEIAAASETSFLVTSSDEWTISGLFALDALVGLGEGAPDHHLLLTVDGGAVGRTDGEISLSGIDGSIEVDRMTPLLTPGVQHITIESGRLGELTVTGGEIEVAARGDGLVRFERFIASMGEFGVFQTEPFSIDPAAPRVDTTIAARNMSLAPWLKLIAEDRIRGEGLLEGQIDIKWDAARPTRFTIEDSTLSAQPSRGWIAVSDETDLRKLLEESDPRFQDDEFMSTVGEKIVAAIEDFAFTSLRLDFEETADGTEFHIVTQGRGRKGEDPQEIGSLTLNITAPFRVLYWAVMEAERLREVF